MQRVWAAHGLKPHLVHSFRPSNYPRFEEKLIDVVGVYLNSPDNAIELCPDEKSSAQAPDRTQPSLPMTTGPGGHDDPRQPAQPARRGCSRRWMAGTVIGQCPPRHRHEEFLTFLRTIERDVPSGLQVHLICDNYATDKHPDVRAWLVEHPCLHRHFTPTSSSWMNLISVNRPWTSGLARVV